jgi:hypothetical protein
VAYRLDPRRETAADARAIASEQIERALAELGDEGLPLARRVFQFRRRSKKIRALLRLVRHSFAGFDEENTAIRDAARVLASLRDTEAMRDAVRSLAGNIGTDRLIDLAHRLGDDVAPPDLTDRIGVAAGLLRGVSARLPDWPISGVGFDAIEGGFVRSYREAERTMRRAAESGDAESLHEWRGRAKHHWSHLTLMRSAAAADGEAVRQMAGDIARRLGDHHNLEVLRGAVDHDDAMLAAITARQMALAREALSLGRVVFGERPSELRDRWRGLWQAAAVPAAAEMGGDVSG